MQTYAVVSKEDTISTLATKKLKRLLEGVLEYDEQHPDLVISIGGDGTILSSVHQYLDYDTMFVGIHTGTLGFFTDYKKEEIDELVEDIKHGCYNTLERHLLDIKIYHEGEISTYHALNEVRLDHGFTTQVIDVYINDDLLEVFRGNGLCISTSSGSTAYNKSLGGSVIYYDRPLMQLSEVAGIHHNAYRSLNSSLILGDQHVIRLEGRHFDQVFLGIDHLSYAIDNVDKIEISISSKALKFAQFKELSFIKRIRRAFISE